MTAKSGAVWLSSRASLLRRCLSNPTSLCSSSGRLTTLLEYLKYKVIYHAKVVTHFNRRQPAETLLAGAAGDALVTLGAERGGADRRQAGCAASGIARTAAGRHRYRQ